MSSDATESGQERHYHEAEYDENERLREERDRYLEALDEINSITARNLHAEEAAPRMKEIARRALEETDEN